MHRHIYGERVCAVCVRMHCAVCECIIHELLIWEIFHLNNRRAYTQSYPWNDCMCPKHLKAFQSAMHRKIMERRKKKCESTDVKKGRLCLFSLSYSCIDVCGVSVPAHAEFSVCFFFVPIFCADVYFFFETLMLMHYTKIFTSDARGNWRETKQEIHSSLVSRKNSPESSAFGCTIEERKSS